MFDSIDIGMGDGFFSDLLGCTNGTVDFFFSGDTISLFDEFLS